MVDPASNPTTPPPDTHFSLWLVLSATSSTPADGTYTSPVGLRNRAAVVVPSASPDAPEAPSQMELVKGVEPHEAAVGEKPVACVSAEPRKRSRRSTGKRPVPRGSPLQAMPLRVLHPPEGGGAHKESKGNMENSPTLERLGGGITQDGFFLSSMGTAEEESPHP